MLSILALRRGDQVHEGIRTAAGVCSRLRLRGFNPQAWLMGHQRCLTLGRRLEFPFPVLDPVIVRDRVDFRLHERCVDWV